jgi:putative spermidine/putrescine transport system substrate-binding protein
VWSKKNVIGLVLASMLTLTALAGCGNANKGANAGAASTSPAASAGGASSGKDVEFSFYFTGSQNVKDLWDALKPKFEQANPGVKVNLVYLPSGTGAQPTIDRLIAAKQAGKGSGGIDLYDGSLSDVTKGKKEDIWDTLSTANIANIGKVDAQTMKDDFNLAVPYRASAVVLAYNSDKVKNPPNTLDEVYEWIRQNPGKFAYNDPSTGGSGDSFVQTTVYKFLPTDAVHNSDPGIISQWNQGLAFLKELGPKMYGKGIYPKKNQGTLDLLANGEVDMIPAWSDMALEQIDKGLLPKSTKLKQLNPGFTGGPAYLMVPKLSDKKDAVYKFINFVLTPEAQSVIVQKMHGFPGITLTNMPQDIQDQFKGVIDGYRIFNIGDLSKELQKHWQSEVAAQ